VSAGRDKPPKVNTTDVTEPPPLVSAAMVIVAPSVTLDPSVGAVMCTVGGLAGGAISSHLALTWSRWSASN